jgi:hypothetical protein
MMFVVDVKTCEGIIKQFEEVGWETNFIFCFEKNHTLSLLRDEKEELFLHHFNLPSCRTFPLIIETVNVFMKFDSNGISMFSSSILREHVQFVGLAADD